MKISGREILVLWAGRHQRRPWEELCESYRERIVRHVPVRDQMLKCRGDGAKRRRSEGEAFLDALPDPCWTIVLDPRGRTRTSPQLASHLAELRDTWPHPIAFVIGSDLGLDERVISAARERLSLGPMVLGHELARLVLYEQIYRSIAIERGIKYHRPPLR